MVKMIKNKTFYIECKYKHHFINKINKKNPLFLFVNNFFCFFAFFLKFKSIFHNAN
jgi:hypothetical protein